MFLPKALLILQAALFGLVIGSFLNVCIYRLPKKLSLTGRSRCPACGNPIPLYRNVPVLTYLFQRGRAACCGAPISPQYPAVEALGGLLAVAEVLHHPRAIPEAFAWFLLFASPLLVVSVIDMRLKIIPDLVSLPFIAVGILVRLGLDYPDVIGALKFSGLGILAGFGALFILAEVFSRLKGVEAMGGGDIKLAAMLGAFLGGRALIFVFFASALLALVYYVIALVFRRKNFDPQIPFGPFLSCGAVLSHLYGQTLTDAYFAASGIPYNPLYD